MGAEIQPISHTAPDQHSLGPPAAVAPDAASGASATSTHSGERLEEDAGKPKTKRRARKARPAETIVAKKRRRKRKKNAVDGEGASEPVKRTEDKRRTEDDAGDPCTTVKTLSDTAKGETDGTREVESKHSKSKKRKRISKGEQLDGEKKKGKSKRSGKSTESRAVNTSAIVVIGEDRNLQPSATASTEAVAVQEIVAKPPRKRRKAVKTAENSSYFIQSKVIEDTPKPKERKRRRKVGKMPEQSAHFAQEVKVAVEDVTSVDNGRNVRTKRKRKGAEKAATAITTQTHQGNQEEEASEEKAPKKKPKKRKRTIKIVETEEIKTTTEETQMMSISPPVSPPDSTQCEEEGETKKPITKRKRKRVQKSAESSTYFTPPASQTDDKPKTPVRKKKLPLSTFSPHFTTSSSQNIDIHRKARSRAPKGISTTPWPPFDAPRFGLIQEELKDNPFHVLISVSFLNRTRGLVAIPMLHTFLDMYPTPEALAAADVTKVINFLQPLGLYNSRGNRLVKMAQAWLVDPPTPGKGVVKADYPSKKTKPFPILERNPLGVGKGEKWEVAHLPGSGAYAIDSWRIFCRDAFLSVDTTAEGFEPEWKRVVPMDKELRAWVRWMWAKEGVQWTEVGPGEEEEGGWGSQQ